jgi:hypothetical protein
MVRCVVMLSLALAGPATAGEATFLIVNPAGRGDQTQAQGFLADLARAVQASWPEAAGPAPALSGNYHVTVPDALASIRGRRPSFALVSPGFHVAHRDTLGLTPLLRPVRREGGPVPTHLVARAGSKAAAQLVARSASGLVLGGQLAGEPDWLVRVVLAGIPDASEARLTPLARTLEAVRRLQAGEIDAAILDDVEWERLRAVGKDGGLVLAHSSPPLPEGPVVALGTPPGDTARAAAESMRHFADTAEGRAVLKTMGVLRFDAASPADYDAVARLLGGAAP